jgi:hypothetical protein
VLLSKAPGGCTACNDDILTSLTAEHLVLFVSVDTTRN